MAIHLLYEEKELREAENKYEKGLISDTTFEEVGQRLRPIVDEGHNYIFVGKIGQFCPIKEGCGGGILYREKDGKHYAVTGTKGYRWLESEMVRKLEKEGDIDQSYYDNMVTDAINDISVYGDFSWFVSEDPYITPSYKDGKPVYMEEIPFN